MPQSTLHTWAQELTTTLPELVLTGQHWCSFPIGSSTLQLLSSKLAAVATSHCNRTEAQDRIQPHVMCLAGGAYITSPVLVAREAGDLHPAFYSGVPGLLM